MGLAQVRGGDKRRQAILAATRALMSKCGFNDISIAMITDRAGSTRTAFYFYFASKQAVLASMLEDCFFELNDLTDHFSERSTDETPEDFVHRMVGSLATVVARNDSILAAGHSIRYVDDEVGAQMSRLVDTTIAAVENVIADEVTAGTATSIDDDVATSVRILCATTYFVLIGDSSFATRPDPRAQRFVEKLWLQTFWGR